MAPIDAYLHDFVIEKLSTTGQIYLPAAQPFCNGLNIRLEVLFNSIVLVGKI